MRNSLVVLLCLWASPCWAAIANTLLTGAGDTTNASSYTTASITPRGNRLVLAAIYNRKGSLPDLPTLSGNGFTWVQIATVTNVVTNFQRLTLFRGMIAKPTAGTVTIDFAGASQTGCAWSISEFTGVNTSGADGSGAVVQSNTASPGVAGTSLSISLVAFGDATNNAPYGAFGITVTTGVTPETNYTEIHDVTHATPNSELETEWNLGEDLTVSASWASAIPVGIAIEIGAATNTLVGTTFVGTTFQ